MRVRTIVAAGVMAATASFPLAGAALASGKACPASGSQTVSDTKSHSEVGDWQTVAVSACDSQGQRTEHADGHKSDKDKSDKDKSDEHKSDKDKSDKDKSDEHKSDKDKSDEDKSDKDKSDKDKSDEHKSDKDKSDEHKSDKDKSDEHKSDKDKSDKDKSDEHKSDKDKVDKAAWTGGTGTQAINAYQTGGTDAQVADGTDAYAGAGSADIDSGAAPFGGVEAGAGGTAGDSSDLLLPLSLAGGALFAGGGVLLARRRLSGQSD